MNLAQMQYLCIILLVLHHSLGDNSDGKDCRFVTNGKKPGYTDSIDNVTVTKGGWSKTYNVSNSFICESKCIDDLDCQMSDFDRKNFTCRLYSTISSHRPRINHSVFTWTFCNLSYATNHKQGAPGFMFYSVDRYRKSIHNLRKLTLGLPKCRQTCFDLDLCGGFNYQDGTCELLVIWNYTHQKLEHRNGSRTYTWMLQKPITYQIKDTYCQRIETKLCDGRWEIINSVVNDSYVIIVFKTRNFALCYKTCEYYSNCRGVIFHYETSLCELKPMVHKPCVSKVGINKYAIVRVEWTCCNEAKNGQAQSKQALRSFQGSCREIAKTKYITLVRFQCTFPPVNISENCDTKNKIFSSNCYFRQAFLSTGIMWKDFLKVYNGYETFWIKNATSGNFPRTEYPPCQLYNATIPEHPKIFLIHKYDWFALSLQETYTKLTLPIKMVIVGILNHSNCLCFEWLHCAEILRQAQMHERLPSNLYISGSGQIFENLGWTNQSKEENGAQFKNSLYIDFIGNFLTNVPSVISVIAFRNLLQFGVREGYISKDYTLLTRYDINNKINKNYESIYDIIRTQPQYNGSKLINCKQISNIILILNVVLAVLSVLIALFFANILFQFAHNDGCVLLRKMSIESRMCKVELNDLRDGSNFISQISSQLDDVIVENDNSLKVVNSSFFWLTEKLNTHPCSKCIKPIQETLRLFRLKKRPIKLNTLRKLNRFCDKAAVSLTFRENSILGKTVVIILQLKKENLVNSFQSILSSIMSGRCICHNYRVYYMDSEPQTSKFKLIQH